MECLGEPAGLAGPEDWTAPGRSFGEIWREMRKGAMGGDRWTGAAYGRLLFSFALLAVCSWLGIVLSHQSEGVATIWLTNGILFGLLITRPRQQWLLYFAAGLAADTLADVFYGDPFRVAFGVSLANSFEVVASTLVLTRIFGTPLNLSKRRPLIGFLLISVVGAAAVTSALGASWTVMSYPGLRWWGMWRTWYLGDMLGMALLAPLTFIVQRPGLFSILQPRYLPRTLLVLLVPTLVTALVFTHNDDPLIFFITPALLLVVFRLGFPGTVLAIFVVAPLSLALTVKGHGPLMLIPGEHVMLRRIVVEQIFLALSIITTFPVAALLEEREALRNSLAASEARYRRLANADDLTGLSNRRAFNLRLDEEWRRGMETGSSLALVLLDVDLFKSYNDLYGHLGGDDCLRSVAGVLARAIEGRGIAGRPGVAARYGGEEFAVILPGEDLNSAQELAEGIRQRVFAQGVVHAGSPEGVQTVSLGIAAVVPGKGDSITELVRRADQALYEAKRKGRNRVGLALAG